MAGLSETNMDTQLILESIAGPAGAVIALGIVTYTGWSFFSNKVWPLAVDWVQGQKDHMESIIKSHEEDRKSHAEDREVFREAMLRISSRQASIDQSIAEVKVEVKSIKEIVSLKQQLYEIKNDAAI